MAADTMMSAMNVVGATLRSEKYDGSSNGFSDSEVHVKWQAWATRFLLYLQQIMMHSRKYINLGYEDRRF